MWKRTTQQMGSVQTGLVPRVAASSPLTPTAAVAIHTRAEAAFHCAAAMTNHVRVASASPSRLFHQHFIRSFHSSPLRCQDHYRILGVTQKATKEEIKKQYYKLAKQYHPDTTTSANAKASTEQFTKIQNAYEVLGDEKARKEYDRESSYSYSGSSSGGFSSGFDSSSSGGGWGGFSGFRPDEQEYSFRSWSRAQGPSGRKSSTTTPNGNDAWEEWEEILEEDDFDGDEEDLFSDLFGEGGYSRSSSARRRSAAATSSSTGSTSKRKRTSTSSSSSSAHDNDGSFFSAKAKKSRTKKMKPVKGADVTMDLHLSFMEAAQGVSRHVDFTADGVCKPCKGYGVTANAHPTCKSCNGRGVQNLRMPGHIQMHVTCERCDGSGVYEPQCAVCNGSGLVKEKRAVKVNIPAGVETATSIRVVSQGHAGKRGGAAGHLLLKAIVASHPQFTRSGYDLLLDCTLPLTTALLGGTTEVPSLTGGVHVVRVSPGTQPGSTQIVPGKGIRILNGKTVDANTPSTSSQCGAQHITWKVDIPKTLSPKSKDLLKQLALEMGNIHNIDLTADIKKHAGKAVEEMKVDSETTSSSTTNAGPTPTDPSRSSTSTSARSSSSASNSSASTTAARSNSSRLSRDLPLDDDADFGDDDPLTSIRALKARLRKEAAAMTPDLKTTKKKRTTKKATMRATS